MVFLSRNLLKPVNIINITWMKINDKLILDLRLIVF